MADFPSTHSVNDLGDYIIQQSSSSGGCIPVIVSRFRCHACGFAQACWDRSARPCLCQATGMAAKSIVDSTRRNGNTPSSGLIGHDTILLQQTGNFADATPQLAEHPYVSQAGFHHRSLGLKDGGVVVLWIAAF